MCEPITATITRVITKGYAECALWENGAPGKRHCIIEDSFGSRRGAVVELASASPRPAWPIWRSPSSSPWAACSAGPAVLPTG